MRKIAVIIFSLYLVLGLEALPNYAQAMKRKADYTKKSVINTMSDEQFASKMRQEGWIPAEEAMKKRDLFDGCPLLTMIIRANKYLSDQPGSPASWTAPGGFFQYMDDDIVVRSNVNDMETSGKANVEAVLLGINQDYQNISAVVVQPTNFVRKNSVLAKFVKTQGSIILGTRYNISFHHEIEFKDNCKVVLIDEFADFSKTEESLALEAGDASAVTCDRINTICSGANKPNFGTPDNNCYYLWKDTPQIIKKNNPFESLTIVSPSKSLSCANFILSYAKNRGLEPFLCPLLGAPIPSVPGCWDQSESERKRGFHEEIITYLRSRGVQL